MNGFIPKYQAGSISPPPSSISSQSISK